jgi:hypothetical protein
MGHMDDVKDDNEKRYTVTVYYDKGQEVFNNCTEVESNPDEEQVQFTDRNGKPHEFYGLDCYHIAEE